MYRSAKYTQITYFKNCWTRSCFSIASFEGLAMAKILSVTLRKKTTHVYISGFICGMWMLDSFGIFWKSSVKFVKKCFTSKSWQDGELLPIFVYFFCWKWLTTSMIAYLQTLTLILWLQMTPPVAWSFRNTCPVSFLNWYMALQHTVCHWRIACNEWLVTLTRDVHSTGHNTASIHTDGQAQTEWWSGTVTTWRLATLAPDSICCWFHKNVWIYEQPTFLSKIQKDCCYGNNLPHWILLSKATILMSMILLKKTY